MPIYRINENDINQISLSSFTNEKELQTFFENHLETLLGVRFIASEFVTGNRQRGRIDTIGIDQNRSPVIIEYKHKSKENVINQGLYYLDWLIDHKGDFQVALQNTIPGEIEVDWSSPRLLLIAEKFSEYDKYAVNRIGANIELWIYRLYETGIMFLDPIFIPSDQNKKKSIAGKEDTIVTREIEITSTVQQHLDGKSEKIQSLYRELSERIFDLDDADEIIENPTKIYIGFKRGKNFCEVELFKNYIKVWLDIEPNDLVNPKGIGRNVSKIGHHGTGKYELQLANLSELEDAIALINQAYLLTL
jgi:predicted transport protein